MNYITSCPACETQFLLRQEHLKAHRGKVQCGNCHHIFNAKNRLTEISDEFTTAAEYQASLEAAANTNTDIEEKPIDEVLSVVLEGVPDLADLNTSQADTNSQTLVDLPVNSEIDAPIIIEDLTAHPQFDKPKTKFNWWLLFLGLLLLLVAFAQTIYFLRNRIASEYPEFKPWLLQACHQLNCQISLAQDLEYLSIVDSDMQESESYEKVIHFSSTLVNNAHYVQAYPNIELTLTDTTDKPLLIKLLKPSDYMPKDTNLNEGMAARKDVLVKLTIGVDNLAVAGYRVLLVY